jgi:hypothetical protein
VAGDLVRDAGGVEREQGRILVCIHDDHPRLEP